MEEEAGDKKQVGLNGVEGKTIEHGLGEKVEVNNLKSTELIEQLVLDESHEEDMERAERESARKSRDRKLTHDDLTEGLESV